MLRQAVEAYLVNDYARVVELLEQPDQLRSRKRRAQAFLLRAASRFALFLLEGESNYELRGQAAQDIVQSRKASSTLQPSEDVFSPRFRDFFAATQ